MLTPTVVTAASHFAWWPKLEATRLFQACKLQLVVLPSLPSTLLRGALAFPPVSTTPIRASTMLSQEQLLTLLTLLLRSGGLSKTTRATLEQYQVGEAARKILEDASDVKYFIMPQPVGRIGVLLFSLPKSAHH